METFTATEFTACNKDHRFTPAELETLAWMAEGKENAAIGLLRGHGEPGAKKLTSQVMHKLQCNNRCLAISRAFAKGYLIAKDVAKGFADTPQHLIVTLAIAYGSYAACVGDGQDFARVAGRTPRITRTGGRTGSRSDLSLDSLVGGIA